jgi:O-antigen/teichoic acid export membrane protein
MSSAETVIAEQTLGAARPRARREQARALSGAVLLAGAMVVSGVLTFAFLALAARALGPAAYGRIGVLWAAMFIVAIVLFRPLEQTMSRAISDRRARGAEVRSVAASVAKVAAVVALFLAVVAAAGWQMLTDRLFGSGQSTFTGLLVAGIAFYSVSYLVRGLAGGALWFNGYVINLVADGVGRLVLGAALLVVASSRVAGLAVVAGGLAGALVPAVVGRRRFRALFEGGSGAPFAVAEATRFALPACGIAAADQLLVNGAPLLVVLDGGSAATKAAGLAFAATMLVRAPVYVFQGVAAALLPNLTRLNAADGARQLRREVMRTLPFLVVFGGVIVALCAGAGPFGMRLLYGHEYQASRGVFTALGGAVGCYLVAMTVSQGLLALDAGRRAALAWLTGAIVFVASYAFLPGEPLTRVSVALAFGSFALVCALAAALFGRPRSDR